MEAGDGAQANAPAADQHAQTQDAQAVRAKINQRREREGPGAYGRGRQRELAGRHRRHEPRHQIDQRRSAAASASG